jgi:drug/metabolite transporter (DMT)-like permease
MAAAAVLFSLMNFFAKLATTSSSWMTAGAVRALIGAFVAMGVARLRGATLVVKDRRAILWRSLIGTAAMASTFYALSSRTLSLGDTVTLLNLTPVFLALLAPIFLRERTSLSVALALTLSLAGVVLILHPSFVVGTSSVGPSAAAHRDARGVVGVPGLDRDDAPPACGSSRDRRGDRRSLFPLRGGIAGSPLADRSPDANPS